jgi:hypothetical protein
VFLFVDRSPRDDRFLEWKIRLFSVAAVLALVGIYLDERWMTGTALVVLTAGLLLRFLPRSGNGDDRSVEDDERG